MLPREHGAYGQLVFPLVTSLVVTGVTWPSVLLSLACVAGFLAHEPLVVLLGHRGRRSQLTDVDRSGRWLIGSLVVATAAAILAVDAMPAALRWTVLVPATAGALAISTVIRGREKTMTGEMAVAVAFAGAAQPVCAAGGNVAAGAIIAAAFGLLFVMDTLAVRAIILRTRGGGNPIASRRARVATFVVAGATALLAVAGAAGALISWMTVTAVLPGAAFASSVAASPPPATRLKRVGWSLVAVTAVTAVLLVTAV
jgi:hypothetical protein